MIEALSSDDVQRALDQHGLGIVIRHFTESTATSQLAADAVGCEVGQIAKSICFIVDGQPVLAIACGDKTVDDRSIAALMGVGRKKVKLAHPEECLATFGYAPGGVPPLGHRSRNIRVFLDDSFKRYDTLYAAGGTANAIFPVKLEQLPLITKGEFADIVRA